MIDRHPITLPNATEEAALEATLQPLFDQTAAAPSPEVLARLTAHAATLPHRRRGIAPLQALALAAVALLAVGVGRWTPTFNPATPTVVATYDGADELDDASWLDDDELGGGFDLLVLAGDDDDLERTRAAVDALLDELGDDA